MWGGGSVTTTHTTHQPRPPQHQSSNKVHHPSLPHHDILLSSLRHKLPNNDSLTSSTPTHTIKIPSPAETTHTTTTETPATQSNRPTASTSTNYLPQHSSRSSLEGEQTKRNTAKDFSYLPTETHHMNLYKKQRPMLHRQNYPISNRQICLMFHQQN